MATRSTRLTRGVRSRRRKGRVTGSAQGIKGKEEGDRQGEAAEDQHILLAGGEAIHAKAEVEVLLEAARLVAGTDVLEGPHPAAAHRAAEADRIEILERSAGFDGEFPHPFIRVVNETATAALETVGGGIAGLS
jgi:hypothetical protein